MLILSSCRIEPPLHLADDEEPDIDLALPLIDLELDMLWDYRLSIDSETGEIIDSSYNWRDEFFYGWDEQDNKIFGTWKMVDPRVFNIRRYFTGQQPMVPHTTVTEDEIEGRRFRAKYQFGYYDILVWNEVETLDGIQSIHFDEETTLERVMAYTNPSMNRARYSKQKQYAYYQPEFLFGAYIQGQYISPNPEDYDYFDEVNNAYYKKIEMELTPRTYIYLTQIILHHNNNRITEIENTSTLQGMAGETNVNTGMTSDDEVAVTFNQRLKPHLNCRGEDVDIIGGRLFTFGICGTNPNRSSRAEARTLNHKNYLDVKVQFSNGMDSTMVFDITDQIQRRYKGGIITVELDMDTVPVPKRPGGAGFDAVIEDYERYDYEFDM